MLHAFAQPLKPVATPHAVVTEHEPEGSAGLLAEHPPPQLFRVPVFLAPQMFAAETQLDTLHTGAGGAGGGVGGVGAGIGGIHIFGGGICGGMYRVGGGICGSGAHK